MSKTFILGGGISGLIWKLYNPEFEVISPKITRPGTDVRVADPFTRSKMVWLHDTWETRQLLKDLGWKNPEQFIKKSRIGYYDNGVIRDSLSEELKKDLVSKKMSRWDALEHHITEIGESPRMSLSKGDDMTNFMNVLDVDHGEMMYRLYDKCPTTDAYVGKITDTHIGICNEIPTQDTEYIYQKYDSLISTMPAPQFWRAWNAGHDEKNETQYTSLPITFVTTKTRPREFDGDYEMVYYDKSLPFTRISNLAPLYCVEFTGDMPRPTFEKMFPELTPRDYWQLPQGRIHSQPMTKLPNVDFSGRFAQWQHEITTEHVVHQAINWRV